jgi:hypothetical protein
MKSTDIKNWRYVLSYKEIAKLDDFIDILTEAIAHNNCILCGGDNLLTHGLCFTCGMDLTGEDEIVGNYILKNVEVTIKVVFPNNYKKAIKKLLSKS